MTDTTNAQAQTAEQAQVGINIQDLQNVVQIIDVASRRGAFEGQELSSVGAVRDRVAAFLAANAPKEETAPEAEGEQTETKSEGTQA